MLLTPPPPPEHEISHLFVLNSILDFILVSQSYPQENVAGHTMEKNDFDGSLDNSIRSFI